VFYQHKCSIQILSGFKITHHVGFLGFVGFLALFFIFVYFMSTDPEKCWFCLIVSESLFLCAIFFLLTSGYCNFFFSQYLNFMTTHDEIS
jgi:hypothetical protein